MIKAFSISENIVYKLFLDYWNPSETLLGAVHCPFFILLKAICYIRWLADFFSSLKKTLLHTHLLSRWCIPHKDFLRLNRNRLVFIWKASNCSEKFRQGCFFWTFRARSFLGDFWDGFACIVWISANMVFGPPFINGRPQKTVSVCWKPFTPVFWSPFFRGGSSLYSTRPARLHTNTKSGPGSTWLAREPEMLRLDWLDTSVFWLKMVRFFATQSRNTL